MTALGELINKHQRVGTHLIACECGWESSPCKTTPFDRWQEYAEHLADEIRKWRFQRPVIRTADQRIEQEIRERGRQINTRKHPVAFLDSLKRKAS